MANKFELNTDIASVPPSTGKHHPTPQEIEAELKVAFNYTTGGGYNISKLDVIHATSDADPFRSTLLFEHANKRLPSGIRMLLYNKSPCISLSVHICYTYPSVVVLIRECICMSNILVLSTQEEVTDDTPVLFVFAEFPPGQNMLLLDGYIDTIGNIRKQALQMMWSLMFPALYDRLPCVLVPKAPYHHQSHKLIVLLDLDKTLFLSDADARVEQRHAFIGDFEIAGNMAITNDRFQHRMMIRPGCYWFLRRLAQIAEIFVITAGDLHYARAAVTHANMRSWISSKDVTTDGQQDLPNVSIPLTRVFSVRNHAKYASKKTFERALPFSPFMPNGANCAVLAVDDDVGAWAPECRSNVIPISPFQPLNNSHEHLLSVVYLIEQAAERFFNDIHTDLNKLFDTPAADVTPIDVTPVDVTPIDVTPIDVTPVDVTPVDVTPVDVIPAADVAPAADVTPVDVTPVTTAVTEDHVEFFDMGRYAMLTNPHKPPVVVDYASGGDPIPNLSEDPDALQQFLKTVTMDHKCKKSVKALVKTKQIIEFVKAIVIMP